MVGFLVALLTILASCGAIVFWLCLVATIVEWKYMDILSRIGNILAIIVGITAAVTCSYIMVFCL